VVASSSSAKAAAAAGCVHLLSLLPAASVQHFDLVTAASTSAAAAADTAPTASLLAEAFAAAAALRLTASSTHYQRWDTAAHQVQPTGQRSTETVVNCEDLTPELEQCCLEEQQVALQQWRKHARVDKMIQEL